MSKAEKKKAILEAVANGEKVNHAAKNNGVKSSTAHYWIKQSRKRSKQPAAPKTGTQRLIEENTYLRRLLGDTLVEKELAKKAA